MNYQRSDIFRCANCFEAVDEKDSCPYCSEHSDSRSPLALAQGTILNGNYQLGKVLGKLGGFGITYLAWDRTLEMKVAIKEYLPRELVGRDQAHATVTPHSVLDGDDFLKGLEKFLEEARTLARIDHPSIVRVRSFFRDNGTAYLVMDFYEGQTLEEFIRTNGGKLSEERTISTMMPVLDGLKEVHAKGILHRDIKPENIYLTKEGRVILLDFGAARQVLQERSRSMTIVLTPGFSPIEQALGKGKQGQWTDVYSCAATMYYAITGVIPQRAEERLANDMLVPIRQLIRDCSYETETALVRAMKVQFDTRTQYIHEFQQQLALFGVYTSKEILLSHPANRPLGRRLRNFKLWIAAILLIFIAGAGYQYLLPILKQPNMEEVKKVFEEAWKSEDTTVKKELYSEIGNISPDSEYGTYARAWKHYWGERNEQALFVCDSMIQKWPTFAYGLSLRSRVLLSLYRSSNALKDIDKAIGLDQNEPSFHITRGDILFRNSDYGSAKNEYELALNLDNNNIRAYIGCGKTYISLKEYDKAKSFLQHALTQRSDIDASVWNAYNEYLLGNKTEALESLNITIEQFPGEEYPYHARGLLKEWMGDKYGALNDYNRALVIEPLYPSVLSNRAGIKYDLGDYRGALSDYNEAIQINPEIEAWTYYLRGWAYRMLGDRIKACEDFSKAGELGYKDAYKDMRGYCR